MSCCCIHIYVVVFITALKECKFRTSITVTCASFQDHPDYPALRDGLVLVQKVTGKALLTVPTNFLPNFLLHSVFFHSLPSFLLQIATECNEHIRKAENELRLFAISRRFPSDDVNIVQAKRYFRKRKLAETGQQHSAKCLFYLGPLIFVFVVQLALPRGWEGKSEELQSMECKGTWE